MTNATERPDTALAEIFDSLMRDIHTCMPGIVTAFDRDTQTATVQPCLQRKFKGMEPQNLTPVENVPIVYPGSGDLWLVFDIEVDSYVLLVFSERSIATWMEKGDVVDPKLRRTFSLSDAIAIPGLLPGPVQFSGAVVEGEIGLRSADGTKKAVLDSNGVLTVNSDADAAALSSVADTHLADLVDLLCTWTPVLNDGGAALKLAALAKWPLASASLATTESTNLKVDA